MARSRFFWAFTALNMTLGALASIGPFADLILLNGEVYPDGFLRQAILPGGVFPGPIIAGHKVFTSMVLFFSVASSCLDPGR